MERKPIMMPPSLIKRTEKIASEAGVSFAEIVRRALLSYDPQSSGEHEATLEALADALITSTKDTLAYLDRVERQLDETHAQLKQRAHGVE